MFKKFAFFAALFGLLAQTNAHADKIIASIQPIHSLVSAIVGETDQPILLIPNHLSPHNFQLKPSDAKKLANAKVIIWIGDDIETVLEKPLDNLEDKTTIIELEDLDGLKILKARAGGHWCEEHQHYHHSHHKHHHHGHKHDDHDEDPHIWLSIDNAIVIANALSKRLSQLFPANKATYHKNHQALIVRLSALKATIKQKLSPVKDTPYLVFHDAYQYFEKEFGLNAKGAIQVTPDKLVGVKRLTELQTMLKKEKIACVFSEPQFEPKLVKTLTRGTTVKTGILDPIGSNLTPGPKAYEQSLMQLADNLVNCLK